MWYYNAEVWYFGVAPVLLAFLVALVFIKNLKHRSDIPLGNPEWTDWTMPRTSTSNVLSTDYNRPDTHRDTLFKYPSVYNDEEFVFFDDPADAYEYIIRAVKQKNLAIDRLDRSLGKGHPVWHIDLALLAEVHRDRAYWLSELQQFEEDV